MEVETGTLGPQWLTAAVKSLHLFKGFGTQAWSPLPLREALSLISSFSLISYNKDLSGNVTGFVLHPLVHSWGRDRLSEAEFDRWSTRSLALLVLSFENTLTSAYKTDRQVLAHISACSRQSGEFLTLDDADRRTRMFAEKFCWDKLQQHGRVEEACHLAERVMKLADARWGGNDSFSLFCMKNVADQYVAMGECMRAMGIYDTVREFANRLPPEEIPLTASRPELLLRYARCLVQMGYFEDAVRIQKTAVDILVQTRGPKDRLTIDHMSALVQVYHSASQYKEATELGDHVFSSLKLLLGTQNRTTLLTALILAEEYLHLNQRSKSLKMYEWLAEIYLSFTSPVHMYDLRGLDRVIKGFFELGSKEKTKLLAASLVDMSQDSLGPEDPETQQWVRWLHFHEFWSEVNAVIEDHTKPITSAMLDRLVATGTDLLDSTDLEQLPKFAEDIAIIRQKLQPEAGCSHEGREEIVESLRGLERNLFIASCDREDSLRLEELRSRNPRDKGPPNSNGLILSEDDAMKESDESLDIKVAELLRDWPNTF